MRRRHVLEKLVKFTGNLLQNWIRRLKFDNYISENIQIGDSIRQGDLLSMVLYQYYNADLIDILKSTNKSVMAYVDNAILLATGANFTEMHEILTDMTTREEGAMAWSDNHNLHFEFSKLVLMDFTYHNSKK